MNVASVAALDGNENFKNSISGFERLVISNLYNGGTADITDTETINLANLGFASYVVTSGTLIDNVGGAQSDVLALTKLAANATVVLTEEGYITAALETATGTTDVINVILDAKDTTLTANTFTVADVETVKITAEGVFTDANEDGEDDTADVASLTLVAAAAKTITIDGSADLTLTTTAANVATIDASAMTGALTYTIDSAVANIALTSGSGADDITVATTNNAQVKTGAGADTITVDADAISANIWGGAGNDTFDLTSTISSSTQYTTIEDATSGDIIKLATDKFVSGAVSITDFDQMSLTDKFNAVLTDDTLDVVAGLGSVAAWFQHSGNTYIVVSNGNDTNDLTAGTADQAIKLTGLIDLSTGASFNVDGTLEIA